MKPKNAGKVDNTWHEARVNGRSLEGAEKYRLQLIFIAGSMLSKYIAFERCLCALNDGSL
jgi:hypothetical protein